VTIEQPRQARPEGCCDSYVYLCEGRGLLLVLDYHGPDRETSPLTMPQTAPHIRTLIRTLRVPPPAAGPNLVLRAASRPRELRDADPYATRAATGRMTQPGSTGRGSYVTTHLGTAGRGITRVPRAAGGPMKLLDDATLPGRIRPY
jgi:hypothetical protein